MLGSLLWNSCCEIGLSLLQTTWWEEISQQLFVEPLHRNVSILFSSYHRGSTGSIIVPLEPSYGSRPHHKNLCIIVVDLRITIVWYLAPSWDPLCISSPSILPWFPLAAMLIYFSVLLSSCFFPIQGFFRNTGFNNNKNERQGWRTRTYS